MYLSPIFHLFHMRVYLDTSVYCASWLFESREGKFVFPEFSKFIKKALDCSHSIVVNRYVKSELVGKYPNLSSYWNSFLEECGKKVIHVEIGAEIKLQAKKTLKTLLEKTGFKIEKLHGFELGFNLFAKAMK